MHFAFPFFLRMHSEKNPKVLLLLVLLVYTTIYTTRVHAIRNMLHERDSRSDHHDSFEANRVLEYSTVYKRARSTMVCWAARLASGPSMKGPGH
jgi:hypothetical protein